MRLVQITVPIGRLEAVEKTLDDEGVDYVLTEESSGRDYAAIAYIPLPKNAVEPVLDDLREAGIDEQAYTVIIDAQTVVSRDFDQLRERFAEEEEGDRIAREELTATAKDLVPSLRVYVAMTVVSAVIATAGLLLDSPAVVVGSMVIAPLIGPAMTTSVGTVVVDDEMFTRGVQLQALGVLLSIVSAAVFGYLVRTFHLVPPFLDVTAIPQVHERLSPDFLSLVVALGAGVAGSLSLITGVSSALVGVMIAVALIPPAAAVGIGIAWGEPVASIGAGVLVLVNVLSINLAALIVLRYAGYRPTNWFQFDEARGATIRRVLVLVVAIVMLSVFLGGVTLDSFQSATTEERIRETAQETIGDEATVVSIEIERTSDLLFREPSAVVVTVGIPDPDYPQQGERLDRRLERLLDQPVDTEVHYVVVEQT